MRAIPAIAFEKARVLEHLELRVYDDRQPKKLLKLGDRVLGTLTGGYGHTGADVKIGMVVSEKLAESWLSDDMDTAEHRLERKIGDVINDLTDNQQAALLLFVLNLGTGNPAKPEWTIWKRLRARQFDQVPIEMMRFVNEVRNGKAVKVEGLVNRRTAEVQLWSTAEPGSVPDSVPSSTTRVVETPPTVTDPTPVSKVPHIIAAAATAAAATGPAADKAIKAVAPYADKSPFIQNIVSILAILAALAALATLGLVWLQHRRSQR